MAKKAVMTLFLVILLLVISGCQNLGSKVNQKESQAIGDTVYKGLKGITMTFVRNSPPRILYTTTPLSVMVELKNEGASDVAGGKLYITGLDPQIVRFTNNNLFENFNIPGRSKFNTMGIPETISFTSQAIYLPGKSDVYKPNIMATACYEYKTKASPQVCIDPDPYSVLEKEACQVRDSTLTGGQGAPVYVSRIEEEAIPGKVNFKITVANQQTEGVVIDKSAYALNRCLNVQPTDLDYVYYTVSMPSSSGNCQPLLDGQSKIKLTNGQGIIFCSFPASGSTAYQTILNIDLSYGYRSDIIQPIEIRSIS